MLFGVGSLFLIFCKIQSLGAAALDGKKMMVFMEDVGWVMNTEVNCKADALLKSLWKERSSWRPAWKNWLRIRHIDAIQRHKLKDFQGCLKLLKACSQNNCYLDFPLDEKYAWMLEIQSTPYPSFPSPKLIFEGCLHGDDKLNHAVADAWHAHKTTTTCYTPPWMSPLLFDAYTLRPHDLTWITDHSTGLSCFSDWLGCIPPSPSFHPPRSLHVTSRDLL